MASSLNCERAVVCWAGRGGSPRPGVRGGVPPRPPPRWVGCRGLISATASRPGRRGVGRPRGAHLSRRPGRGSPGAGTRGTARGARGAPAARLRTRRRGRRRAPGRGAGVQAAGKGPERRPPPRGPAPRPLRPPRHSHALWPIGAARGRGAPLQWGFRGPAPGPGARPGRGSRPLLRGGGRPGGPGPAAALCG